MSDEQLTQEEINELLNMSVDGGGSEPAAETAPDPATPKDVAPAAPASSGESFSADELELFNKVAQTSTKALDHIMSSMLMNQPVEVKFDCIKTFALEDIVQVYPDDNVIVAELEYITGVIGKTMVIFKKETACSIADFIMGGDGKSVSNLEEMHQSALQEMMNLLNGKNSTELSTILKGKAVDIGPPRIIEESFEEPKGELPDWNMADQVIQIVFNLKVGDVVDTFLSQVYSGNLSRSLIEVLRSTSPAPAPAPAPVTAVAPAPAPAPAPASVPAPAAAVPLAAPMMAAAPAPMAVPQPVMAQPGMAMPQMAAGGIPPQPGAIPPAMGFPPSPANPVDFGFNLFGPGFGGGGGGGGGAPGGGLAPGSNIDLLLDIPLQVTVELGRTTMEVKEILEIGIGSVVELKKLAGEPVEMFVNNKLIAKGEVVVIDENFSIRITSIVSPEERLGGVS